MITKIANINSSAIHIAAIMAAVLNTENRVEISINRLTKDPRFPHVPADVLMAVRVVIDASAESAWVRIADGLGFHWDGDTR